MSSWIRRTASATAVVAVGLGSLIASTPPTEAATAAACSALSSPVYKTVKPSIGAQLLTRSATESKTSISARGFTENHGVLGYAAAAAGPGLTPVTRMYNPKTVDYLWVTGSAAIAAAKAFGYQTQTVDFYASASPSSCTVAVHKFAKTTHRRNAWTAADKKLLLAQGWKDAGVAFYLRPTSTSVTSVPAPTPTPTPTPAPTASGSGYGVPAGTALKVVNGDMTITKAGTVLSNVDLNGYLSIQADNVTIQNSILRGGAKATAGRALVMSWSGAKNLVIKNSTLIARNPSAYVDGISGKDLTVDHVDISNTVDAVKVTGSNVTIRNSRFHNAYHLSSGVSYQSDGTTHNDGVQVEGGGNITISGNTISGFHNAAVMVTQNAALITGLTITGNTLSQGGCTVNMAEKGKGPLGGVKLVSNKFGVNNTGSRACPMLVPATTNATMTGNTWLDTGAVANAYRG